MNKIFNILAKLFAGLFIVFSLNLGATIETYEFDDPELELRFKKLVAELRCPKCQNQNLADSDSDLSKDLKRIVYDKVKSGQSEQQVLNFMKERYGEFILFKPELNQSNVFLWTGPILFLVIVIVFFLRWYANNRVDDND
jgi:cytochrome c-type biogenesis protein CcmH